MTSREQSRARYPDASGFVERDGVKLHYEVYGSGEPTVLLLPTWSIVHSRHWKMQIPYLSRHCRVVAFDGRGNGRSDRPAEGYGEREFAADALAVMDATGTASATSRIAVDGCSARVDPRRRASQSCGRCGVHLPCGPSRRSGHRPGYPCLGRAARHRGGLGEVQPLPLAQGLPGVPRVLLLTDVQRAALDQADRGLRRLGFGDLAGDSDRDSTRRQPRPG